MGTRNPSIAESPRPSRSEPAGPMARMMRESLGAKLRGDETDEQVRRLYAESQPEREAAAAAAERERREADERLREEAALRERRATAEYLFKNSDCPPLHIDHLDLVDENACARWREIRDLLHQQSRFAAGFIVGIVGRRGTGKTELAVSLVHRCCEDQLACQYIRAADIFRDFRRAYVEQHVSEAKIAAKWAAFDVLVIDELHEVSGSDAENRVLANLLDRRYADRRCTLLIANLSRGQFAAAVGPSIASRIIETGEVIECDWPSFRKPGHWRQSQGAPLRSPTTPLGGGSVREPIIIGRR